MILMRSKFGGEGDGLPTLAADSIVIRLDQGFEETDPFVDDPTWWRTELMDGQCLR